MSVYYEGHGVTLHHGDCLDVLKTLPDCSVDSVVTDPPYGLEFMGKEWDKFGRDTGPGYREKPRITERPDAVSAYSSTGNQGVNHFQAGRPFQRWCEEWATECLRVLKPGGHLLAFGGSRTYHRMTSGVEDAGFEIRDCITWHFGSGFPKSLDVSKAIDRAAGAEREVVGSKIGMPGYHLIPGGRGGEALGQGINGHTEAERLAASQVTAPATPDAERWQGWGTALKPATEFIVVARKPLTGTVAATVLEWGTGALNIDACRVEGEKGWPDSKQYANGIAWGDNKGGAFTQDNSQNPSKGLGRWPANVVFDEHQAAVLDEMSGESTSQGGSRGAGGQNGAYSPLPAQPDVKPGMGDTGGASRFFFVAREDNGPALGDQRFMYVAKADAGERPRYHRPSCDCETMKPWQDTSPQRDTAASRSGGGTSWSTSTSGSSTTDGPSHPATTSTTSTGINSTTTSGTFDSSPNSSTSASTPGASSATVNGGSPAPSAERSSPSASRIGTSVPKGGPSTAGAGRATSPGWSETSVCANCGAPARRESHATVKPLALMRWLVRLVTPPGGTVLEPFAGSGTTVEACIVEGFQCVAIEKTDEYLPLILSRITRRRDPVAAIKLAGGDLGLFDLDGFGA